MMEVRLLVLVVVTLFTSLPGQAHAPRVIQTASDLPAVDMRLPAMPTELARGGRGMEEVTGQVVAYARSVLQHYELNDRTAAKRLVSLLRQAALLENRWEDSLRLSQEIRQLEEKPALRAGSGLIEDAYAQAALVAGEGGQNFLSTFKSNLEQSVGSIDSSLALDALLRPRADYFVLHENSIEGRLRGFDLIAKAQGMRANLPLVSGILDQAFLLQNSLPLREIAFDVLNRRVQKELKSTEDLWSSRLEKIYSEEIEEAVIIAVWDTGMDPNLFQGRFWTNSAETINGQDDDGNGFVDDVHGPAFDDDRRRSTGMLRQMPEDDLKDYARIVRLRKGWFDISAGLDSPDAHFARHFLTDLQPDKAPRFWARMARIGEYVHGTGTANISLEGNPAARLLNARFSRRQQEVMQPIDEVFAQATAEYARDTIDYFKRAGVRVVNMSFRLTEADVSRSLASVERDPARRAFRAKAIFSIMFDAFEQSMAQAPGILFVAAAGNDDENVDFVKSFPAGINLPNVISVGAVNKALQPTSFTSYGNSIDVYANGTRVPFLVPEGYVEFGSGTSAAAPYVTNLAGKIWALRPEWTLAQVRDLIEATASSEGPGRLKVINPRSALERGRAISIK